MKPYQAVGTVGKNILVFRDKTLVGRGFSSTCHQDVVTIEMKSGEVFDQLAKTLAVQVMGQIKWVALRYSQFTGGYVGGQYAEGPEGDELDALFSDTEVVDEFDLSYGMVPDMFADHPGYLSAFGKFDEALTLDEALASFEAAPFPATAETLEAVASTYFKDEMIEQGTYDGLMQRVADFRRGRDTAPHSV